MGTTSMSRAGRHRREKTTYIENSPIDCTRQTPECNWIIKRIENLTSDLCHSLSRSYGDWCASNAPGQGGCTSVSALLNSVYFILDIKAALSILHAGNLTGGSSTDSPSEAELTTALTQARSSFRQAFLRQVVVPPLPPSTNSIAGLTFRDPWPPNVTHHGNPNRPPTAQVEAAAGDYSHDADTLSRKA